MRVAAGILRGLAQHPEKQLRRHELAARAGDEEAARAYELHALQIELLIPAVGAFEHLAALGEGGRVADDEPVLPSFGGILPGKVKDVRAGRRDAVGHAIKFCISPHEGQRLLRHIHRLDRRRTVERGMDGKAAGAAAQVEHILPGRVGLQPPAVFLLVEEMAGLLPVFDADEHPRVVLPDDELLRDRAVDAGLDLRQPLFFAHGQIVPLIDPARGKDLREDLHQRFFPLLETEAGDLERQAVGKFVDGQPRQPVRLAEDHPARVGKAQRLPRLPRRADAAGEKVTVDRLLRPTREHADGQLRPGVKEPAGHEALAAVQHVDDAAVGADIVRPVQLVVIDQLLPLQHTGFLPPAQADLRIVHSSSYSSSV